MSFHRFILFPGRIFYQSLSKFQHIRIYANAQVNSSDTEPRARCSHQKLNSLGDVVSRRTHSHSISNHHGVLTVPCRVIAVYWRRDLKAHWWSFWAIYAWLWLIAWRPFDQLWALIPSFPFDHIWLDTASCRCDLAESQIKKGGRDSIFPRREIHRNENSGNGTSLQ